MFTVAQATVSQYLYLIPKASVKVLVQEIYKVTIKLLTKVTFQSLPTQGLRTHFITNHERYRTTLQDQNNEGLRRQQTSPELTSKQRKSIGRRWKKRARTHSSGLGNRAIRPRCPLASRRRRRRRTVGAQETISPKSLKVLMDNATVRTAEDTCWSDRMHESHQLMHEFFSPNSARTLSNFNSQILKCHGPIVSLEEKGFGPSNASKDRFGNGK
uniref:Reverse transcriptase domain-containing protein n=1 Tax=Steinernema glaseri TaxID=37863 RepID=A0A1I7YVD3_9BILA